MLSGVRERIEDLTARAGLAHVPAPALAAAAAVAIVAVCWAAFRWGGSGRALDGHEEYVTGPVPSAVASAAGASAGDGRAEEASASSAIVVHVVGAVRRPGVFRLAAGSRGEDAVRAAGGTLGDAAPEAVNLARVLEDGEQLAIPTKDEAVKGKAGTNPVSSPADAGVKAGAAKGGKVDINAASETELDALPGIGPSTAAKIVAERDANGPFATVDDLARVPGIGAKKIDALRDMVTVR